MELLEILKKYAGCLYISDLRMNEYYNMMAKSYLSNININNVQPKEIVDTIEYLYCK